MFNWAGFLGSHGMGDIAKYAAEYWLQYSSITTVLQVVIGGDPVSPGRTMGDDISVLGQRLPTGVI